jgi:hypothetical protein
MRVQGDFMAPWHSHRLVAVTALRRWRFGGLTGQVATTSLGNMLPPITPCTIILKAVPANPCGLDPRRSTRMADHFLGAVTPADSPPGRTAWLVHRQRSRSEQHDQRCGGVDDQLDAQPVEVGAEPAACGDRAQVADRLGVQQQQRRGHEGERQLDHHPPVPEEPPFC